MRYPNPICSYQSGGAAMVASLLLLLTAVATATAKPCLTKAEAKNLWPNEWLYWHTERHCWEHIKGTSGKYEERQPAGRQHCSGSTAKAGDDDERKKLARTRNCLSNDGVQ